MKPNQSFKLLLGIKPDADALDALEEWACMYQWAPGTELINSGHYHLPLHQIGTVSQSNLQELKNELEVEAEPYDIELKKPALYKNGRAVMLSASSPPAALQELHALLGLKLKKWGD